MALSGSGTFHRGAMDSRNWSDGASRLWGQAWADAEATDPRLPDVHWCLDMRLGAARIRVSTGDVRMPTSAGQTIAFGIGLAEEIEVDEGYTPGESAGSREVTFTIPNRLVAAQSQIAAGYVLAGDGELFLATSGMTYENRLVVLDGDITGGVDFGDPVGGNVRATLADPRESTSLPVTPFMIEENRFTAAVTATMGQRFPYVFNQGSDLSAYLVSYGAGAAEALVCVPGNGLEVSKVYVNGTEYGTADAEYGWTDSVLKDDIGAPFLGVSFAGTHTWTGEESVTVDVTGGEGTYVHEAVLSLLEGFTSLGRRRIHYGLISELVRRIGSVEARVYANGSGVATFATATDILEQVLGDSFPMLSFVTTDGRYGPVVTDARLPTRADLVLGIHLLNRESDVTESDKSSLRNHFTLFYSYNHDTDAYDGLASRSPDNSVLCSRSVQIIGARHAEPVESTEIYAEQVANFILDWRVFHQAMPNYYLEYSIPLAYLLRIGLGWNIRLTDTTMGWTNVTATVTRRVLRRGLGTVGLTIYWPNLAGVGAGGGAAGSGGASAGGGQ